MKTPRTLLLGSLLAVLWLAVSPARAGQVTDLYETRVPVTDQSAPQLNAALQQAFAAVLVKVTGNRAAPAALAAALGNPHQYLQQYRYEQVQPDPNAASTAAQAPSLMLWAKFGRQAVDRALHAAHSPVWGLERPRTLMWLTLQDAPGGRVLAASDTSYLMQALSTAAQQRGVVLVFPQMDGPDKNAIGVPDLTGFNQERIRQASSRYRPDAILVGSVTPFGTGQFAGHWQLLYPDRSESWDTPAGDEVLVAVDGVQVGADHFASRYAIAADATDLSGIALQVDGITTLDAYAKVQAYISALTPVRAVSVQRVAQGSVYFSVDIHGSVDNLQSALSLGGLLAPALPPAPVAGTAPAPAAAAGLRYSYTP